MFGNWFQGICTLLGAIRTDVAKKIHRRISFKAVTLRGMGLPSPNQRPDTTHADLRQQMGRAELREVLGVKDKRSHLMRLHTSEPNTNRAVAAE